jgi:galactosylceramidase
LSQPAQSWAPEWLPYTILGDRDWRDYEVSADIFLDNGGWAGVMGRVNDVGSGYGCVPKGYYLRLDGDGACALYATTQAKNETVGTQLATSTIPAPASNQWHTVKLEFFGSRITGLVDGTSVLSVTNRLFEHGMAGLVTGGDLRHRNTACFDNLIINAVGAPTPPPTIFAGRQTPIYPAAR